MKVTKLGHCCMVIETRGVKILTDPGMFSTAQNELTGIELLLITHEHADHYHIDSVKAILKNNPNIKIITNKAVGKLLSAEGIKFELVGDGQSYTHKDVVVSGHGTKHAVIYKDFGQVENTGFFVDGKLFFPGDAFYNPKVQVEILALPVSGPWAKISEVITYALDVKPKIAFPVHDAVMAFPDMAAGWLTKLFAESNIDYKQLNASESAEF